MVRSKLLALLTLLLAAPAAAQVPGPTYTFVVGTVADPDQVNTNFETVYDNALYRLGPVVGGHMTFSPDATYDLGASGATRPRDGFFSRNVTIGGTLSLAGVLSDPDSEFAINDAVQITLASVPQLSVRYDATHRLDLSVDSLGNLTFDLEGAAGLSTTISDPVTISTSGDALTASGVNPIIRWRETGVTADNGIWRMYADAEDFYFQTLLDDNSTAATIFSVGRTGTTVDSFTVGASMFTAQGQVLASGATNITTAVGNNNNLSIGNAFLIRLTDTNGGDNVITGFAGGSAGRIVCAAWVATGGSVMTFGDEAAASTAANRFALPAGDFSFTQFDEVSCFIYDGTSSRWRPLGGPQAW